MAPLLSSLLVFSLLLIVVFVQAGEHQSTPFTYMGPQGPENWGSLCPSYAACSNGKSQSPIDIVTNLAATSNYHQTLVKRYTAANATLINNGFNIGVHFENGSGGMAVINGKSYTLQQMHWHSPSEHRLNGQLFAAELHLVHQADDGSLSVIGILLQYGDPDPLLQQVQDKLAALANGTGTNKEVHVALGDLEPKLVRKNKYYRYTGSLTTPPCTENVMWTILGTAKTISKEQIKALKLPLAPVYKNNARPVQPLNDRKIEIFEE
ncbi:Alpha carbonic anhydrase 1, chloroplastic, partial [Cucurbita argyrosperma subsp. sororia]